MLHPTIIDQVRHLTGLLWILLGAIFLAFAPFAKPTEYRQSLSSRFANLSVIGLGLYLLFAASVRPLWFNRPLFPVTAPIAVAGFLLVVSGLALSLWARRMLGGNWSGSATLKQGHSLIRRGPYGLVRHPIYTGFLLAALGTALEHGLVRGFLAVPIFAFGFWRKLHLEERLLAQRFGEDYLRYRRDVRALVPFLF